MTQIISTAQTDSLENNENRKWAVKDINTLVLQDKYGKLEFKATKDPNTVSLHYTHSEGSQTTRNIGVVKVLPQGVLYEKCERITDIHHNLFAWSIQKHIVQSVDYIKYITDLGNFIITSKDALNYGVEKPYGGDGIDKKLYVSLKRFRLAYKDNYQSAAVTRLGLPWAVYLFKYLKSAGMAKIWTFLRDRKDRKIAVFPEPLAIFRAFKLTPYNEVKVVILGQDPYHTPGMATGLSFGVNGKKIPPSLKNIKKELDSDIRSIDTGLFEPTPFDYTLESWAKQGVLMLNTCLTVDRGQANSHSSFGWDRTIVMPAIKELVKRRKVVYVAWGAYAKKFLEDAGVPEELTIFSRHPSPYSADKGFFGSKPFSKVNQKLKTLGLNAINWK